MNALILLSHGSRRQRSSQEMRQLAEATASMEKQPFDRVVCAFQQFAQPAFDTVLRDLVSAGVTRVVVYPLFLAAGSHVLEDVPEMIHQARATYPGIDLTLLPHLGQTPGLAAFLLKQAAPHA